MLKSIFLAALAAFLLLIPQGADGAKPTQETGVRCNNGVDDDRDGLIDSEDPDCEDSSAGGGGAPPDNVRANFHQDHMFDGSVTATAIQSDDTTCNDGTGLWHYVNPTDSGCVADPKIYRSTVTPEGGWWLGIQGGETAGPPGPPPGEPEDEYPKIVVDRWATVTWELVESGVNWGPDRSVQDPTCPNLDALIFEQTKYQDDDGDAIPDETEDKDGIANDGGIPVIIPENLVDPTCTDNLVIMIQTGDNTNIFDLPDNEPIYFSRFWIASEPSDPNTALDGGRFWKPRFVLNYYQPWEKQTLAEGHIVLRSKGPDHKAELWEVGIKGPARNGSVADYKMPAEIELKRVTAQ